jgi:two-component system, cell cycle response regulator
MTDSSDDFSERTVVAGGDTFSGQIRAASNAPPSFVCLMGPQSYVGRQWALTLKEYVIGRAVESAIFVDDPSVSRSHARLTVVGNEVIIVDQGSSNKTVVGTKMLTPGEPVKLRNNDQVKTGNVIFKFLEQGNIESAGIQQLTEKAEKDGLTGIFTKGALLQKAPEFIKRSDFLTEALSIVAFDLDHFKKINDTYGHSGGDYVLKELAQLVQKLIRSQDYFARYGGEEFVIMIVGSPDKNSVDVAERIRATIHNHEFIYEGKRMPVSVSIGIAHRRPTETWESLYKRADEASYVSKQGGRNRVTVAT